MKFVNSMYKRVIASCTCAIVSDFKHRGGKMFLLNISTEHQNFVKSILKIKAILKMQTICELNFHEVESFHKVECKGDQFNLPPPSLHT